MPWCRELVLRGAISRSVSTGDIGPVTVLSGVVTVLARTDAVSFRLHPVQRPVLALSGGGVSSLDRLAERLDEIGSITSSGVTILAGEQSVY